ncbi:hypothetical protein Tco_0879501 [Tanacetum coccineum]
MGEITFFLGLQVKQKKDGIFISQDKYVDEILKKFMFTEVKTASTPMETQKPLLKDEDGEEVDVHMYRSMIGSLMFAVCACARYQVNPKVSHLHVVKRIFRYLKRQPKLGLWYPKDSLFDLVAYTDSDYAGASLDRKSITGEKAKKSVRLVTEKLVIKENRQRVLLILANLKFVDTHNMVAFLSKPAESEGFEQIVDFLNANPINREVQLYALVDGKKIIITESTVRRDLQLEDAEGVDCLSNSTIFEQLTLMGYEKISQKREGLANPTDPHHTPAFIQPSTYQPQKKQKPRKLKRKDTQIPKSSGPTKHVAYEVVYKELDDSLVRAATTASSLEAEQDSGGPRGNTLRSSQDSLKLKELMELCTNLQTRVLDLEKTKTTQAEEIVSLKRRVKKLEQKKRSRTHGLKRLYKVSLIARVESSRYEESLGEDASKQGRINAIDVDEDITLVNDQDDADMFDVNTLIGDEVLAEQEVAAKDVNLTVDEVTLAQALAALKSVKPKVKANVIEEPSVPVSATNSKAKVQEKGKGILVEGHVKPKKKDLIRLDEEISSKLQAEVDVDYQLAQRLQAEEQKQFTTEQKAILFKELLEQRRKHFVAKRAEKMRNKPPTQAQQRKIMYTYLNNMEGKKPKDLKNKSFDSIQKMFDTFKRVNTFVDFRTDLVEGSSKRVEDELEQEVAKKQKVDDVQETAEVDDDQETSKIKDLMKIVYDEEEVAIDAIPLATKPPSIVDWKIHKEGKRNYYQIIRANGNLKMYLVFSHMLKSFDREDFETL